jgi:hypothetical protein
LPLLSRLIAEGGGRLDPGSRVGMLSRACLPVMSAIEGTERR